MITLTEAEEAFVKKFRLTDRAIQHFQKLPTLEAKRAFAVQVVSAHKKFDEKQYWRREKARLAAECESAKPAEKVDES